MGFATKQAAIREASFFLTPFDHLSPGMAGKVIWLRWVIGLAHGSHRVLVWKPELGAIPAALEMDDTGQLTKVH